LREFIGFVGRLRKALAIRDEMLSVYIVTTQETVRTFVRLFNHITARRELVRLSVCETMGGALNAAGIPPRQLVTAVPALTY
jgi:hypothetical protein